MLRDSVGEEDIIPIIIRVLGSESVRFGVAYSANISKAL